MSERYRTEYRWRAGWIAIALSLWWLCPCGGAERVQESEGFALKVDVVDGSEGPRVIAEVSNDSDRSIEEMYPRSREGRTFQVRLWDAAGNELAQEERWANYNLQKASLAYQRPRSSMLYILKSGESRKFEFDLKDAYGERAAAGRTLLVSWEPTYKFMGGEAWKDPSTVRVRHEDYVPPDFFHLAVEVPMPAAVPEGGAEPAREAAHSKEPGSGVATAPMTGESAPATEVGTQEPEKEASGAARWISIWAFVVAMIIVLLAWLARKRNASR